MTNKLRELNEIKGEFKMFVPEDDGSAMDWLENTLTQDRQFHKQALLDRVEGMKQREKAINGEYLEIETDVNFALDDITDIINELYKG